MADYVFNDYVLGSEDRMDLDKLANLIEKCKGSLSHRKYAELCGISASTFSNIINKRYKRPCAISTLVAIYDNRCESCQVTLEELLEADGYVKINMMVETAEKDSSKEAMSRYIEYLGKMTSFKNMNIAGSLNAFIKIFIEKVKKRYKDAIFVDAMYSLIDDYALELMTEVKYVDWSGKEKRRGIISVPKRFMRAGHLQTGMVVSDWILTHSEIANPLSKIALLCCNNEKKDLPNGFTILVPYNYNNEQYNLLKNVAMPIDVSVLFIGNEKNIKEIPLKKRIGDNGIMGSEPFL